MSSTLDRLVTMANQIARNLGRDPDPEAAVADHIARFWDPRMKAMIFDRLDGGAEGLDPLAAAAVRRLQRLGSPPVQSAGTCFEGGSDAG